MRVCSVSVDLEAKEWGCRGGGTWDSQGLMQPSFRPEGQRLTPHDKPFVSFVVGPALSSWIWPASEARFELNLTWVGLQADFESSK